MAKRLRLAPTAGVSNDSGLRNETLDAGAVPACKASDV